MSLTPFVPEYVDVANPVIRAEDLLAALWYAVSERSGGPPTPFATIQDDSLGQFVWTSTVGEYLLDENNLQLVDENNEILVG